jgi:hypothetical protein
VERPGTPSPPNTGNTKCIPTILPMGESGEAPRVERPGTPSPTNTSDTECADCALIILPMDESVEAPRVERPGTPSPPNTSDTECVPIILPMGESGEQGWAKLVLIALERYSVALKRLTFNLR